MRRLIVSVREAGFSLVEVMVVVAVIGMLAAIAIPNFKKYQSKSKTVEAKLQLAAIYTSENSFSAYYDSYATCLYDMGYNPSRERLERYYVTGFGSVDPGAALNLYSVRGASSCADSNIAGLVQGNTFFDSGKGVGDVGPVPAGTSPNTTYLADDAGFTAAAFGVIDASGKTDEWVITQNKEMSNTITGF